MHPWMKMEGKIQPQRNITFSLSSVFLKEIISNEGNEIFK